MRVADEIAGEAAPDHGPDTNVDKAIKRLLDGQLYGVLCTQGQGQPYSLPGDGRRFGTQAGVRPGAARRHSRRTCQFSRLAA